MQLRRCFNHSEDQFTLPEWFREVYGPFGFPPLPSNRPYVSSNFVQTLDGRISFRELPGKTGGDVISQSGEDRLLVQFLRAHHDAQLLGANTLREEPGPDGLGFDYGALDPEWQAARRRNLGRDKSLVVVLSGSGAVNLRSRVFHSEATEALVITSREGEKALRRNASAEECAAVEIVSLVDQGWVNAGQTLEWLRLQRGVRTLICEAGATLYSQLIAAGQVDEEFRTMSLQVAGESTNAAIARPTPYGPLSFEPETAPWLKLISLHYALPSHMFLRLRF